jgi:hypothetical protein
MAETGDQIHRIGAKGTPRAGDGNLQVDCWLQAEGRQSGIENERKS